MAEAPERVKAGRRRFKEGRVEGSVPGSPAGSPVRGRERKAREMVEC